MRSFTSIIVIATGLSAGACVTEPVDEPEPSPVAVARNAPTHSVTGGGRVDYDVEGVPEGYRETYGFSARTRPDGSVDGNIEMHWDPPFDFKVHGDITCLNVVGNAAAIGLVITRTDNPDFPEGAELLFAVRDNGNADQLSGFFGAPAEVCRDVGLADFGDLFDWTHGNVTVR